MKPVETFYIDRDPLDGSPLPPPVIVPPKAPAHRIIAEVAREYRISVADLTGESRKAKYTKPRKVAMKRIRTELGYSYPKIGRLFNRDHCSVIWACRGGRPQPRPPHRLRNPERIAA